MIFAANRQTILTMSDEELSTLKEIVGLIGYEQAMQLALELGGRRLYVARLKEEDRSSEILSNTLDDEAVDKLRQQYAGCKIHIPLANPPVVRWLHCKGWKVADLAARFRRQEKTIRKWIWGAGLPLN